MNRFKSPEILFYTILISSFILRVFKLGDFSFTNDEFSSIVRLNYDSFGDLIKHGIWVDGHPAGVQVFMFYWAKLFGYSEFWFRFPFAVFSTAAIFFGYKFAKKISGIFPALLFAVSLGFLEFYFTHSRIARPYASGLFFAMLNAYLLLNLMECTSTDGKKKIIKSLLLGLSFALQAYNHYFGGLLAFLMALSALLFANKKNLKFLLISIFTAVIAFSPHIPITINHLSIGGVEEWLAKPNPDWILDFLFQLINRSFLIFSFIIIVFVYFGLIAKDLQKPKFWQILSFIWFADTFIIAYLYSIFFNSVLVDRVLIFSSPFFILSILAFLPSKLNFIRLNIVFTFFILLIISTFWINMHYQKDHFANFKKIPSLINDWEKKYNINNLAVFAHANSEKYLRFYEKEALNLKTNYIKESNQLDSLKHLLSGLNSDYIAFVEIHSAHHLFEDIVKSEYSNELESYIRPGKTKIRLYSKKNIAKAKSNSNYLLSSKSVDLHSDKEYFGTIEIDISEKSEIGDTLIIEAWTYQNILNDKIKASIVMSVKNQNENYWRSANFKYFNQNVLLDHKYKIRDGDKTLKIYIWNKEKQNILIDSLKFEVYQNMN